ncbi:calcium-binding protein [Emcibacter nanhaiensis]|uniref:Calcium-binding protein n=1 Tax=Emcibacter nanhaiensis TaxID=1505037 RepID=A0A501PST9_9PROT|nr:calcium-binding protein [Emcibacter nanhaiensis]TPD63218.1 calcium-binding protein [Emcibacter nanhaiensis]
MSNATVRKNTILQSGSSNFPEIARTIKEVKAGPFSVKGRLARTSVSLTPLLLAACGGGGSTAAPTSPTTPTTPSTPSAGTFTETSTNTWTAVDDSDSTLDMSSSTEDLTVIGKGGDDTIITGAGNDDINGGGGLDTINAGPGADIINGGGDYYDIVSYETSSAGVTINLTTGEISGGDAEGDTLIDIEWVTGSAHDDTLVGDWERNVLRGGDGDDILYGMGGWDSLYGGAGENYLYGGDFDDAIVWDQGGEFLDHVDGGEGNDLFTIISPEGQVVDFDLTGKDIVNIERIYLSTGEQILRLNRDDIINVTDANNSLTIGAGSSFDDQIIVEDAGWTPYGIEKVESAANIYLVYDNGSVFLKINPDANTEGLPDIEANFTETTANNFSVTTPGQIAILYRPDVTPNLTVTGDTNDDSIYTGDGDDQINAGAGNDFIFAGLGYNYIYGGPGDDKIYAFEGSYIDGGDGDDIIYGGEVPGYGFGSIDLEGNELHGGTGNDYIYGSEAADLIAGDDGDDFIIGYEGDDTISGGGGADVIWGMEGNDQISGGAGDDSLDGYEGDDQIAGDDGSDMLSGNAGDDILDGGAGNDFLSGDGGVDILYGGIGDDHMILTPEDSYDGGDGEDAVQFYENEEIDFDLSQIDMVNIEIVDIDHGGSTDITFTVQDILDVTDADNILVLQGDADDTVTSTGEGWVQGADQDYDGETYHTYTSGGATLLVDQEVTFTI